MHILHHQVSGGEMVVEEHMQKYSNIFGGDVPYDLGQDMKRYTC